MAQIVNGYACNNSADIALARRGIDPAGPKHSGSVAAQGLTAPDPAGRGAAPPPDPARTGRGSLINLIA